MSARAVWFVAGAAAGVYTSVKARRAAYRMSTPGIVDQAAALGLGWRELKAEAQVAMQAKQRAVVEDLYRRAGPLAAGETDRPALDHLIENEDTH
ncbi:MAG: DUF6167 family protein [Aeromicrobium sp.]|uniref:DUF6167 family protein n=1 Tax=Aeromicrobium sp. TaxID=1871063 RepID=UPI0039E54B87